MGKKSGFSHQTPAKTLRCRTRIDVERTASAGETVANLDILPGICVTVLSILRPSQGMHSPIDANSISDRELVRRAREGCVDSFEALVRRHQWLLRRFLAARVGDLAMVDDIAQETFLAVTRNLEKLEDGQAFSGWLISIANNKWVDHVRRQSRSQGTPEQRLEYARARYALEQSDFQMDGDAESLTHLQPVLADCIARLGETSRTLIHKFYFENQSATQLAKEIGRNPSAVRMALLRIRRKLARCIRKQIGGSP